MRNLYYFQSADAVSAEKIRGTIAVVADVLRATSTIVTALYSGCVYIIPVKTVQEARRAVQFHKRQDILLGGERNGRRIDGFDLGNSPQEYSADSVDGKIVITTTTNGTKALVNAAAARETVVLSFLNMSAVAEYVAQQEENVSVIAAGDHGDTSIEDAVCCGFFIDKLYHHVPQDLRMSQAAQKIAILAREYSGKIEQLLQESPHGQFLQRCGYGSDLITCAQIDACAIVPLYADGRIEITNKN
ncbi:2-phosphosulfolactate phosphatase [candidate division KSB1 bacterium]|nr:2-phosphosulfolactate phosphatase [candidate division KSB1 bacterium]RQW05741.1 MAG: 2-phosphosulfolactate phosphatase [candidate division KSB1 bacterium]